MGATPEAKLGAESNTRPLGPSQASTSPRLSPMWPDGQVINAGVYVLEALAKDPAGIAYANSLYAGPHVKALPLSRTEGPTAKYWEPTSQNVFRRDYPLTRFTTVFLDRQPGRPVDPPLKEFLRYILSRDGMAAVVEDGAYVPLNEKQIDIERQKLE